MSDIEDAQRTVREAMAKPGDWLTSEQPLAVWREFRDSSSNQVDQERRQALSPNAIDGAHAATEELSAAAMEVVHRTASDPGRLTRVWADDHISELGEETYTELVGVTAIVSVLARFDRAMGRPEQPLPQPSVGEPARVRPDNVGDIGAVVSQTTGPTKANVSRTLGRAERVFLLNVVAHHAAPCEWRSKWIDRRSEGRNGT